MITRLLAALTLCLAGFSSPAWGQADTAGIRIRDSLNAAPWRGFQAAVVRNDANAAAAWVHFPLRVNGTGSKPRLIRDSTQFVHEFGRILPPDMRGLIARLPAESLWTSWCGTATPRGELWFDNDRLVTINLP